MQTRVRSQKIYEEMCQSIPGGVNSPVRSCKGMGQLPIIVSSGLRDQIIDADGNCYIDYCNSWGALIHGHAHPQIVEATKRQIEKGTSFGTSTVVEGELAQQVTQLVSSIEKIRFVSSGTEATMSAVRLARGFTKRELVIKFNGNYHGHADCFLVQSGSGVLNLPRSSSTGIPTDFIKHTLSIPYNDINTCRDILRNPELSFKIAAVIIEPISGNMGVVKATQEFLQMLRDETQKIGALLIWDEVITGFRVALGGAQELFGIKPDLTCFGKIIGGGFPAAAFGGRKDIMNCLAPLGHVYQAGTLSGNPVAMVAGLEALKLLQVPDFYAELQKKADIITRPVAEEIKKKNINACIQQQGSMFTLFFGKREVNNLEDAQTLDMERFAQFFRFLFNQGIYIPPSQHEAWFISSAHQTSSLEKTRDAILNYIKIF